ncbi:HEAT repeat domain-containing protein [Xanthomonas sp. GW]|uniref:HEAT repeat domain-containing protein n=1 Tax=Xanthomonas sp. GW TaxID=2724121 RepID=UPI00163A5674|nr:HEAT repeat domain-containing protein [Xanthomonas sp. GW]
MAALINIVGKSFDELMGLFFCEVLDDDDFYDVVAAELAKDYRHALETILGSLSNKRLRAGICGLGMTSSIESEAAIKNFLHHDEALVVAAAIDGLRRIGSAEWPIISSQLHHPSPYVRGAALRYAKEALDKEARPLLLTALDDEDPIVRENAIDELDGLISADEACLITPYLNDPAAHVRQAAQTLLDSLC